MKPKTSPPSPATQSSAPTRSTRARARRVSWCGISRSAIAIVTTAIGTFRRKITRQLEMPISHPPSSGPITVETPVHAVQVPIAAPRSFPEKVDVITASDAGVSSAPATP